MQRRRGIGCDTWSRSSSKCPRGTAARKPVRFREIRHRGRSSYSPDPAVRFSLLYAAKKRAHLLRRSISPNIFQPDYFAVIYRRKFKFSVRLRYIHTCVYMCVYTYIYIKGVARGRGKKERRAMAFSSSDRCLHKGVVARHFTRNRIFRFLRKEREKITPPPVSRM